jgi:superfamily II DNA or RNA helicase
MEDPRKVIQTQAKQAFLNSNKQASLILPTGSGKTKVCIDLLKEINPSTILILVNSTDLRDNNWNNEIHKWNFVGFAVQLECYQTAYKKSWQGNKKWDFIVYDEADFALTEEYQTVFSIPSTYKLAMTGFITEEKEELLSKYLPIVFRANVEDLQQSSILNKSEFIFVEYPMSTAKTLERKLKTGGKFYTSENDEYKYWDKQFQQAMIVKTQIEKKYRLLHQSFEDKKDHQAAHWKFISAAAKRKKVLHTLQSTIDVTKNLINHIHSKPDNKILIFNTLTEIADHLPNPFHGKSDVEDKGIEKLNSGEIITLSSVKKITRGTNLVGVNYLIRATYDGSETDFNQSNGRLMRLRVDQVAKYVILLPMYVDLVKVQGGSFKYELLETQAFKWKDKMMQSLNNATTKTIRLDKTLTINPETEI